ncbi:MAG: NUDIX domain-containing protein, partial [Candidatus Aenigmatarchaeota archaeon]
MDSKLYFVTVVAVIHDTNGRILVLKRRDNEAIYPSMYTFPGGKIEGFENVEEALSPLQRGADYDQ